MIEPVQIIVADATDLRLRPPARCLSDVADRAAPIRSENHIVTASKHVEQEEGRRARAQPE